MNLSRNRKPRLQLLRLPSACQRTFPPRDILRPRSTRASAECNRPPPELSRQSREFLGQRLRHELLAGGIQVGGLRKAGHGQRHG
jgi:hypothetical protein